ncbi:NTF2-like protein [Pluteus cervinus]|uniref:NTF2-like protein n=1 Tax=Pluteus cervinus TaxID=181527 RepID=A0ACD3A8H0_9AGAR|nr:NTF2-like protein [Pluteus cervinus]
MYSSQTAAQGPRTIVGNALRGAGLIDRDTQMRDATDKPGGRKGISKMRSHRPRAADAYKDVGPSKSMLASRISGLHAGPSDPLSIRGASRPTVVGRMRRNAVSGGDATGAELSSTPRMRVTMKSDDPWREFVQSRWNPQERFLNLESMLDSEVVKKHNLTPPGHGGNIRQANTIFRIASQLKPGVKTLSLANNALNGALLVHIDKFLPRLVNLSLQNNQLRVWGDLEAISSRKGKMKHLRELILTGNPIREMEFQHGRGEQYKADIIRRFPSLEVLDQEPIVSISFDVDGSSSAPATTSVPAATTFPCHMNGSFITGVDGTIVGNFLVRFFNLFDHQQTGLVDVYDPAATFSFCANTNIPNRARVENLHNTLPNQHNLTWGPWITDEGNGSSRNLSRIGGGLDKTIKSLHIGPEAILKALSNLPGTIHEIDGPPEKFCVDAFPIPHGPGMGLLLVIHGQFTEAATKGLRSFDRTFVLVPAPPGSRAQINGWGVIILSDEWTIRAYSNPDVWKPGPMVVQPSLSQPPAPPQVQPQPQAPPTLELPADQQAALSAIPDPQRSFVVQICMRTGLNVNFAVQCLQGNDWDLERAVANFLEVKVRCLATAH